MKEELIVETRPITEEVLEESVPMVLAGVDEQIIAKRLGVDYVDLCLRIRKLDYLQRVWQKFQGERTYISMIHKLKMKLAANAMSMSGEVLEQAYKEYRAGGKKAVASGKLFMQAADSLMDRNVETQRTSRTEQHGAETFVLTKEAAEKLMGVMKESEAVINVEVKPVSPYEAQALLPGENNFAVE